MFDGIETPRLIYLVLLAALLIFFTLASGRGRGGSVFRQAAVWSLIFVGTIAAVGLWLDVRQDNIPRQAVIGTGGQVEVRRHSDGHFYLTLDIRGVPVNFVVDTGATELVLSRRDAERVGIDPDRLVYQGRARTANGEVRTARVVLDEVGLGGMLDNRVTAWVNEGRMDISLLGMSYLRRFERIEITGDRLVLHR
jgi:aspartyl protease family protein